MQVKDIIVTVGGVEKTYKPRSVKDGVASLEDRSSGVAIGYNPLTITSESFPQVRRVRIQARVNHLSQPASADSTGFTPGPKLDRYDEVDVVFKCNRRSAAVDRQAMVDLAKALLAHADVLAVVVDEDELL